MEIIVGKHGNQKMPISEPTVSRRHCKITPNNDGTYTVENLSETYGTKIDGKNIIKAKATPDSQLQLGPYFKVRLGDLIGVKNDVRKPEPGPIPNPGPNPYVTPGSKPNPTLQDAPKIYDISHLRFIWEEHNQRNIKYAEKQKNINLVRTGGMVFTMGGSLVAGIASAPILGGVCAGLGLASVIYSFFGMKGSESTEEKQARQDYFDSQWVCPNPKCGRTLPAKNYKMLVRNHKSCPYCKSKYVEKKYHNL